MNLITSKSTGIISAQIITEHGRRSISTGERDVRKARILIRNAKIAEIESAAKTHRLTAQTVQQIVAGKVVTCHQAVAEFGAWQAVCSQSPRTIENYRGYLASFLAKFHLDDKLPSQITDFHISQFVNATDGTKRTTRVVRLVALRKFLHFCTAKVYSLGNPAMLVNVQMSGLSHEQKEPRHKSPFTVAEIERLQANAQGFWKYAISIALWTGLRLGDIASLEWDSLELPWDSLELPLRITVWTDKRDRRVSLPLTLAGYPLEITPEIIEHFAKMEREFIPLLQSLVKADDRFVFPVQQRIASDPKLRAKLSTQFGRLYKKAGVIGHTFHDLRRNYCDRMDKLGVPISHIARSVGHQTEEMTKHYLK